MNICIVHRYYAPDTPHYALMLPRIAERLVADGHTVTVLSSMPDYHGSEDQVPPQQAVESGVHVRRFALPREDRTARLLRVAIAALFVLRVLAAVGKRRRELDLLMVASFPPLLGGLAARTAQRLFGIPFVYHCQDLHPEVDVAAGLMAEDSRVVQALRRIDTTTCQRAERVVVLSGDMARTVQARGLSSSSIEVLNNFAIHEFDGAAQLPEYGQKVPNVRRVLFAGNLGRFQNLDKILDVAQALEHDASIEFLFVGDGVCRDELQAAAARMGLPNVRFLPHQPVERALALMGTADIGLVPLAPGVIRTAYPSKVTMYLEAGSPIIAMVEPSDLGELLKEEGVGRRVDPNDVDGLADAVRSLLSDPPDRGHVRTVARKYFGQDEVLARWSRLYAELDKGGE